MDKAATVHKRKKRYMAIILDRFEQEIEPLVPKEKAEEFKGIVRQKLHALAIDAIEVITLDPGVVKNEAVFDLKDQLDEPTRRAA